MVHRCRLEPGGANEVWDLEDLVVLGKRERACPYFGARELSADAEIVFCPYNDLIDPKIRHSLDINCKDAIVVIDEAHNAEDVGRSVAGATFDCNRYSNLLWSPLILRFVRFAAIAMKDAVFELKRMIEHKAHVDAHAPVLKVTNRCPLRQSLVLTIAFAVRGKCVRLVSADDSNTSKAAV